MAILTSFTVLDLRQQTPDISASGDDRVVIEPRTPAQQALASLQEEKKELERKLRQTIKARKDELRALENEQSKQVKFMENDVRYVEKTNAEDIDNLEKGMDHMARHNKVLVGELDAETTELFEFNLDHRSEVKKLLHHNFDYLHDHKPHELPASAVSNRGAHDTNSGNTAADATNADNSSSPVFPVEIDSSVVLPESKQVELYNKYSSIETWYLNPKPQIVKGSCPNPSHTQKPFSTVEYVACCGLGHRMARMSAASHVAQQLEAQLYGYWECCGHENVFHHLFGQRGVFANPPEKEEPVHMQFRNEVPGFQLTKDAKKLEDRCPADPSKVVSEYHFYRALMDRYHAKTEVESFVKENFEGHTVIGLYIRGSDNKRINHMLVENLVVDLQKLVKGLFKPPVLFLATDEIAYVEEFKKALVERTLPIIPLPILPTSEDPTQECLLGWDANVREMMLLSHADIVVAATPTSFTQTMPMSVALNRPDRDQRVARYCEVYGDELECFSTVPEWQCKPQTHKADTYLYVDPAYQMVSTQ